MAIAIPVMTAANAAIAPTDSHNLAESILDIKNNEAANNAIDLAKFNIACDFLSNALALKSLPMPDIMSPAPLSISPSPSNGAESESNISNPRFPAYNMPPAKPRAIIFPHFIFFIKSKILENTFFIASKASEDLFLTPSTKPCIVLVPTSRISFDGECIPRISLIFSSNIFPRFIMVSKTSFDPFFIPSIKPCIMFAPVL